MNEDVSRSLLLFFLALRTRTLPPFTDFLNFISIFPRLLKQANLLILLFTFPTLSYFPSLLFVYCFKDLRSASVRESIRCLIGNREVGKLASTHNYGKAQRYNTNTMNESTESASLCPQPPSRECSLIWSCVLLAPCRLRRRALHCTLA